MTDLVARRGLSWFGLFSLLPGLAATLVIAGGAFAFRALPGFSIFSPPIIAVLVSIALRSLVRLPASVNAGVSLSTRQVLRLALILLGFQVTATDIFGIGASKLLILLAGLVATFSFIKWLGRLLGVDHGLAELIAAGTSVCGASAIVAANTVTRAREEDVTYAVACITLFGTVAMLVYPVLAAWGGLSPELYGLWVGASIHEVAQVVAAAFQHGDASGQTATIAKLFRVLMLAPLVTVMGFLAMRASRAPGEANSSVGVPWYIVGFLAAVLFNSFVGMPGPVHGALSVLTTFLLTVGLAGMGLGTDIAKVRRKGLKPLVLAFLGAGFISTFSLALLIATQ